MTQPADRPEVHLGMGVYASYDGFRLILRTGSELLKDQFIALEPHVYRALVEFVKTIQEPKAEEPTS